MRYGNGDVQSLWMIGCGNMAGAMLSCWLATGLDPGRVTVIDPALPEVRVGWFGTLPGDEAPDVIALGLRVLATTPDEPAPDWIMLGVKPQMLAEVAPALQVASDGALLLSILAGTRTTTLATMFPNARAVLRVMPNLPVARGNGVAALHGTLDAGDRTSVMALMARLGLVEWIEDEAHFDAVTALSGSGSAFLYRFIDALAKGGGALGLPPEQAARLALATVQGAAATAAFSDESPAALAERVASKGGSTRMGLDVLDQDAALEKLIAATLKAAEQRNREMAEETRSS